MLENGATTLWELWEKATGTGMNSHNHPMPGSVGSWFYRYLAGIRPLPDSDGLDRFELAPSFVDGLKEVDVAYDSFAGTIVSHWKRENGKIRWEFTVPANTQALVRLPGKPERMSGPGAHRIVI